MGMFDYVYVNLPCPWCGHMSNMYQSKDGPCNLNVVEPQSVMNFYESCTNCGKWIEYTRHVDPVVGRKQPYNLEEVSALGFLLTAELSKNEDRH